MTDYNKFRKSSLAARITTKKNPTTPPSRPPQEAVEALEEAQHCWEMLDTFRQKRRRCRMYTFGNQWGDAIYDTASHSWITEEMHIKKQGKIPLKNNLIRQLVKSVLGQYRSSQTEPLCVARDRVEQQAGEMMTIALQYNYQLNQLGELDARSLEEFLISGVVASRATFGWKTGKDKQDVWVDLVNPNRLFFDSSMEDVRHWDCNLIGEIHDLTLADIVSAFATNSHEEETIRNLYSDSPLLRDEALSAAPLDNLSFRTNTTGLCRVIEVWRRESRPRLKCHDLLKGEYYKAETSQKKEIEAENKQRIADAAKVGVPAEDVPTIEYEWYVDRFWYYRYLTPEGQVLREGESPFWHKEHPYTFKLYPFIDGEVHSFVADVIDQQRYINRLITMIDFIMGSSAKGVLLFPEEAIPEGMTIEQVAEEWTRYNGVILCKSKPGVSLPQQISTNATNVGAFELLNIQLRLLDDISGVHGAMQGKTTNSGTPASLYAQQTVNSSTNLIDLLSSFRTYREERDTKSMKLIQQYYTDQRYINIAGRNYSDEARQFSPELVRNTEFDLHISQSTASPVYRSMADSFLIELFKAGQINIEMLLENGSFPFADKLLQNIRANKEQLEQGSTPTTAIPTDVREEIEQGSNPDVLAMLLGDSNS